MTDHPTPEALGQFILGQLAATEMREIAWHLLNGCAHCHQTTSTLWEPADSFADPEILAVAPGEGSEEEAGDGYDAVLDRVFEKVVVTEAVFTEQRAQGRGLLAELQQVPAERQHLLVANCRRFRNRGLCDLLVEESHETGFQSPRRAVELARLAVLLADRLTAEECGGGEVQEGLRARAWAQLGNAHRISSNLAEAESALAVAEELLNRGRIGFFDRARVLALLASLRRAQERFAEALQLFDRVVVIYKKLGQWNLLGRTLLQKSLVCGEAGDGETEMSLLRHALDLLDPQTEPRLFLAARHNLIHALHESGRSREAFALLFHTRPLYLKMGDRMNLLKLRWLEGQVAAGLQRLEQAEAAFREVREAYAGLGLDYDAALASLDLASLYAAQGRTADLLRVAEETLAVFQARNVHREALAALLILCHAARGEQAGAGLVRQVSEFLKRARNHPDLRPSTVS
ncbi:MAG TPA: tetratricopeptide repeat protein [Thermoanaerobaculia bacterium]|jgi:tetratricopeptide (TPR) repeat protein|nr:tetratricopeptide repeat protein [Thermoanaerobaculia bacterium]